MDRPNIPKTKNSEIPKENKTGFMGRLKMICLRSHATENLVLINMFKREGVGGINLEDGVRKLKQVKTNFIQ